MRRKRSSGFTLVELMVAMTIGLVLALAVGVTMVSMGQQFRITGSTTAAQVNAQLGLALIDAAGSEAGLGLFSNGQPLCQRFNAWRNGHVVSDGGPLMPARIVSGGQASASDQLIFTASDAQGPLSALPVLKDMATIGATLFVSDSGMLDANDLFIVGVPGSAGTPCTLMQATSTQSADPACGGSTGNCKSVNHATNAGYNPAAGTYTSEPLYGFAATGAVVGPAVVQRLGPDSRFRQDAFAVMCLTLVRYNRFMDSPACSSNPLSFSGGANALVPDVVLLKAQYGLTAAASSDVVDSWVDATGIWTNPGASDVGRIKALRVVIVTRSRERADTEVTAAACTNGGGVVNTGPCSFADAQSPVIDLSAVPVPGGSTWRQYRYRVNQAVIPLRSVIWGT